MAGRCMAASFAGRTTITQWSRVGSDAPSSRTVVATDHVGPRSPVAVAERCSTPSGFALVSRGDQDCYGTVGGNGAIASPTGKSKSNAVKMCSCCRL